MSNESEDHFARVAETLAETLMSLSAMRDCIAKIERENDDLEQTIENLRSMLWGTEFELEKAKRENAALRGALLEAWDALPADEFIEDHDPIAASTFKRLNKVLRAAIDAARKGGVAS